MENSPCHMKRAKKTWIFAFVLFLPLCLNVSLSESRRVHLTPEQQAQLANADSILIRVLALTEKVRRIICLFSKPLQPGYKN